VAEYLCVVVDGVAAVEGTRVAEGSGHLYFIIPHWPWHNYYLFPT